MKVRVELDTLSDVREFVKAVTAVEAPVHLVSENLRVSAKSLLGAMYTMEWSEVWCECEEDIYNRIARFVI